MKNFGKALSLVIALIFVLTSFSVISIGAADATADPLDQNLIIHYDFEGADVFEAITDKAPAGAVSDDLTSVAGVVNFAGLEMDTVNGTAKNKASGEGFQAIASADTQAVSESSTWFVRVKLDTSDGSVFYFAHMNSRKRRPGTIMYQMTDATTGRRFGTSLLKAVGGSDNFYFDYAYDFTAKPYVNVAVVVTKEADGTFTFDYYQSEGLAKTADEWNHLGQRTGKYVATPEETELLYIMTNNDKGGAAGITMDDFRLYNKALTLDEIATIIPNGSFDGQLKEKPADTTPPADTGDTPADTGDTPADTGDTPADTENTPADTNEAPADTSDVAGDTAADTAVSKKGCKGAISAISIALVTVAGIGTAVVAKKKREE